MRSFFLVRNKTFGVTHCNSVICMSLPDFVLTCPCNDVTDCNSNDMNMVCTSGKCACAVNYVFNRPNNICIFGEILPRQNLLITKC